MGSEADKDLNIRVSITGDTVGAKQAEDSLKAVTKAAEGVKHGANETAKETKELGTQIKELSHLGHEAQSVLEGIEKGGLAGLAQAGGNLAKVLKTAGATVGSFFGGIPLAIAAGVGGAVAAALAIKKAFEGEGESAEQAAKKTELLNKELAEIRAAAAEATAYQIKKIGLETEETIKRVQALKEVLLHLNDNKLAVEQSKIKGSETLTPVQKERAAFDAENTARKSATDETLKAIQLEIDTRKKEQALRVESLNQAVEEERQLRAERDDLKRQQSDIKEFKAKPSAIRFDEFGNDISDPEAAKKEHEEALSRESQQEDIDRRLKLIEGNGPENGGLLDAKSKSVIELSRAASESDVKNLGAQGKDKRAGGEIETLETAAKVAKSDYETKQILSNDEFVAKQRAETKKLETEKAALESEKKALADKNTKSLTLGGDPADVARIAEITKKQSALDQDLAQRRGTIPSVQDNTKKRINEFQNQQTELGKEISANPLTQGPSTKPPGSGGTIEKDGETIKVSSEHTVEELKKLGKEAARGATETAKTATESARAVAVATPKIQEAAAKTGTALAGYNTAIIGTMEAQLKQIKSLTRQVQELKAASQATADNS